MSACASTSRTDEDAGPLRLLVAGSPRSGKSWLRGLLAATLELDERLAGSLREVDWEALPERCVVQAGCTPAEAKLGVLASHGVRVVTPARHPLDVLISELHDAYYDHDPAQCTRDECGICSILGVSPRNPRFLEFTRSASARDALTISWLWWDRPETIRVRYETLVADTPGALREILQAVGEPARFDPGAVAARFEIEPSGRRDSETAPFHIWRGIPGLWRLLLTVEEARTIAAAHVESFTALGYECDPDPFLDAVHADLNWYRMQLETSRIQLRREREDHRAARAELSTLKGQLGEVHRALWRERERLTDARPALARADDSPPHDGLALVRESRTTVG